MDPLAQFADHQQEVKRLGGMAVDLGAVKEAISHCATCGRNKSDGGLEQHEATGYWLCNKTCRDRYRNFTEIHLGLNRRQRRALDRERFS